MEVKSTTLTVNSPFSLKATVLGSGLHECSPLSWCEGGRCLQAIEREKVRVYRLSVTEESSRKRSTTLRVTVEGVTVAQEVVERMSRRVRVLLRCDHDYSGFHELCRRHPKLRMLPTIGAGRSLRPVCMAENIIKALCWTNVVWSQAVKMINRLGQLGPTFPGFANLQAWPTPREILRAGEKYLSEVCRLGYRVPTILRFCRDVEEGRFNPIELDRLAASPGVTSDDLLSRLRSIHGVGPSSAHYLLSFLERHDRLAIDSSTIAHVRRTHTDGRRPTLRQIERIYAPFGEWKNLVWWFEMWINFPTAKQLLRMVQARHPTKPRNLR